MGTRPTLAKPWLRCWVPDLNRFSLAKPPDWFLHSLYLYDDKLFLIPSRQQPVYRLARSIGRQPGQKVNIQGRRIGSMNITEFDDAPDTKMLYDRCAAPIRTIQPYIVWTTEIIDYLRSCDIWAQGGAAKVAAELDAAEERERQAIKKRGDSELDARLSDAVKSLRARQGERISMRGQRSTPGGHKRAKPIVGRPYAKSHPDGPLIKLATAYTPLPLPSPSPRAMTLPG